MKIKTLILKNFRAYKGEHRISLGDLNVFIGKNDIGKSSILEALDIFLNEKSGVVKFEKEDLNKVAQQDGDTEVIIGCVFTDFVDEVVIDSTNKTKLSAEYLLNDDGDLEVIRKVNAAKSPTFIAASHPSNDEFVSTLLEKKIKDLQEKVTTGGLPVADRRIAAQCREAIRGSYPTLAFEKKEVPVDGEGAKQIWEQLEKHMPLFALFQSDRQNKDGDAEIQDPMKIAIKEILKREDVQEKLQSIASIVDTISGEIAQLTLEKLNEMNPEIAKHLKPIIPTADELKWEKAFGDISIESDDGVPLNKRGSGVRRLVLLNFFRAQAERRQKEKSLPSIIYAIEEPETSQHPDHQKKLIRAFIDLAGMANTQIILTTHSPAIAQLLPVDSLRLIENNEGVMSIFSGSDDILLKITSTLGVLPTLSKLVICVEGENDKNFLLAINQKIYELKSILDLEHKNISVIPMKGSNLKAWIENYYLEHSNVVEFHLYDKDADSKYKDSVDKVNKRTDGSSARLTTKVEMENYINPSIINTENCFSGVALNYDGGWDTLDVSKEIVRTNSALKEDVIKQILNGKCSQKITKQDFEAINAWEEVEGWFKEMAEVFSKLDK